MKSVGGASGTDRQLRWAVLLLMAAVLLPTVCLLWFMSQAVKNERFAVKQKLVDMCNSRINDFKRDFHEECLERQKRHIDRLKQLGRVSNVSLWAGVFKDYADALVVYDSNGQSIYPVVGRDVEYGFVREVQYSFEFERQGDYSGALAEYRRVADSSRDGSVIFAASMGAVRCLDKLGRGQELLALFDKLLDYDEQIRSRLTANQVARIRVALVEWLAENDEYERPDMYRDLTSWYTPQETYSAETTIWALKRIIKIAEEQGEQGRLNDSISKAEEIIEWESDSLAAAEFFDNSWYPRSLAEGKWKVFEVDKVFYAVKYFVEDKEAVIIESREEMLSRIEPKLDKVFIDGVNIKLVDGSGNVLSGSAAVDARPFVTADMGTFFPGWKLELYFENGGIFNAAAGRQTTVYIWTGVLVILLILVSGAVAAQAIGRQIKLNRLKNNFVATITHELKTPLASMRVLVDTLLEGNYKEEKTADEYLCMICRENERLSRLIDNFLCFSRMERNKQAFDMAKISPVEVANAAVGSIESKFQDGNVDFSVKISRPVGMIYADKDAMVTVLINLLDNAYKYTDENKRITLKVFEAEDSVCFVVEDNGVGIPKRLHRKIFSRFYQVDRSLARRADGTGLGLSIVKFIVDIHKGRIDVKSEPGRGSTFTVSLPRR